jgi:branched-chain amino acid transport system ATP-binding protein
VSTNPDIATASSSSSTALRATEITVRFGGLVALNQAGLEVTSGTIVGLMGPNGAGKSTLFDVICGLRAPSAGSVTVAGIDITNWGPTRRARLGLARTFQQLSTFASLSVVENLLVAREARRPLGILRGRNDDEDRAVVAKILSMLEIDHLGDRVAGTLPTGQARLVEIGRALCIKPRFLLLDEPTAGLGSDESQRVVAVLRTIHEEAKGELGILIVEHHIDVLVQLCKSITVLDFGRVIATGSPQEVSANRAVIDIYLGGEVANGSAT